MKKILKFRFARSLLVIALILLLGAVAGCNSADNEISAKDNKTADVDKKSGKVVTVTTSFLSDMVKQLAGDLVEIKLIIPAGEDPHLYIAKPKDTAKIETADLLLYHGLYFEGKMLEVLEKKGVAVTKNFPEEKLGHMEENGQVIIDPHFWFNIGLYKEAVVVVSEELIKLLPEHKTELEENTIDYLKQLDELDEYIRRKIAEIPDNGRYLITPHDAFSYFAEAYDIEVMAPQGVSTDSEVSNKDLDETAQFIADKKIKAIFVESTTDPAQMEKLKEVVKAKGFEVKVVSGEGKELFSDSLAPEGHDGDTFISMYKHNVDLITENLK